MSVDQNAFLDTNVLLYLLSADTRKAETAESVLETGGVINIQVLSEFVNVCQRKLRMDWSSPKTFAMHRFHRAGVNMAVKWFALQDHLDTYR